MKWNKFYVLLMFLAYLLPVNAQQHLSLQERSALVPKHLKEYVPGKIFVQVHEGVKLPLFDQFTETTPDDFRNFGKLQSIIDQFSIDEIRKSFKYSYKEENPLNRIYTFHFNDQLDADRLIEQLNSLNYINYVEKVPLFRVSLAPFDPDYNSGDPNKRWHFDQVNAEAAWDISTGDPNVVIAIIDNAIMTDHEDLNSKFIPGVDVADGDTDTNPPACPPSDPGCFSHGTHVAGVAAAASNDVLSGTMFGNPSMGFHCMFMPIKITSDNTSDPLSVDGANAILGVEEALNHPQVKVLNMSWGAYSYSFTCELLFREVALAGKISVAAAGNDNTPVPFYPAACPDVIGVGSTDENDQLANDSNFGLTVDIYAPGVGIWAPMAITTSSYDFQSGTSVASPMVAGLAGLMLAANPGFTPSTLALCLANAAENIEDENPGYVGALAGGRIDAYQSVLCEPSEENDCTAALCQLVPNWDFEMHRLTDATGYDLFLNDHFREPSPNGEVCGWLSAWSSPHIIHHDLGENNYVVLYSLINNNGNAEFEGIVTEFPLNLIAGESYTLSYDYAVVNNSLDRFELALTDQTSGFPQPPSSPYTTSGVNMFSLDLQEDALPTVTGIQDLWIDDLAYIPIDQFAHQEVPFVAPNNVDLRYLLIYAQKNDPTTTFTGLYIDNIIIRPEINLEVSADRTLIECEDTDRCANLSVTGADSYVWEPATGIIGSNTTPDITVCPAETTTYFATGYDEISGCSETVEITITVEQDPVVSIDADITELDCYDGCAFLQATGADFYFWEPVVEGQIGNPNSPNTFACPDETMIITVTGIIGATGCSATADILLTVDKEEPVITIDASPLTVGCATSDCTDLTASGADVYNWYNVNTSQFVGSGPTVNVCPTETTTYLVNGYFEGNGCDSNAEIIIEYTGDDCNPCQVDVVEECTDEGYVLLTAYSNGVPIVPPPGYAGDFVFYVNGVAHYDENPVLATNDSYYSVFYALYDLTYPWDDACSYTFPSTQVSIYCEGPCEAMGGFILSSCNDDNHLQYQLQYPPEHCMSMCADNGYGTVGVFDPATGLPLDESNYSFQWNNGATTNFISGPSGWSHTVTVTENETGCQWEAKYKLSCCRIDAPSNLTCTDVYVQCGPGGPIDPNPMERRITWDGVGGASYYELEFTYGTITECCVEPPGTQTIIVEGFNYYELADTDDCFEVRVRAYCRSGIFSDWSETYTYCEQMAQCETEIVICHGCCDGGGHLVDPDEGSNPASFTEDVKVYPNPARNRLNIESNQSLENGYAQVFNLFGKAVLVVNLQSVNLNTIELPELPGGVYMLAVRNAEGKLVKSQKIEIFR